MLKCERVSLARANDTVPYRLERATPPFREYSSIQNARLPIQRAENGNGKRQWLSFGDSA
jgi:hypothetical protein